MRKNEDRFTAPAPVPAPSAAIINSVAPSPSLNFVIPTEAVLLPSEGKFYPEGHPLYNKDTVIIKHMTAKEEDILTSKSLIKKGTAIDLMLQGLILDPSGLSVSDILLGDKNALLIAARITGYGADYKAPIVCPLCTERTKDWSFDLSEGKTKTASDVLSEKNLAECGATFNSTEKTFTLTLPKTKATISCKLLSGNDEKKMMQWQETRKKLNMGEAALTDQFKACIVSVNGSKEQPDIANFVENMPASDSKHFRHIYDLLSPNVNLDQNFTCKECGYEQEMEVPFTTEFFWPKR